MCGERVDKSCARDVENDALQITYIYRRKNKTVDKWVGKFYSL